MKLKQISSHLLGSAVLALGVLFTAPALASAIDGVNVVDGTDGWTPVTIPQVGQVLYANTDTSGGVVGVYPVDPDLTYVWECAEGGSALGTGPIYTATNDNRTRKCTIQVTVTGDGVTYTGNAIWTADAPVGHYTVNSVDVVDGDDGWTPVTIPLVGQKLYANTNTNSPENGGVVGVYPVDDGLTYEWRCAGSSGVLGTEAAYTVTADNVIAAGCTLQVIVTGVEGSAVTYVGTAIWTAGAPVGLHAINGVDVVDGTDGWTPVEFPLVGQVLYANTDTSKGVVGVWPVDADLDYEWRCVEGGGVLGTEAAYSVTDDNRIRGCTLQVIVKGKPNLVYSGSAIWTAKAPVGLHAINGVNVVDGTDGWTPVTVPLVGQVLYANTDTSNGVVGVWPVDAGLAYVWRCVERGGVLGTAPAYTVTADNVIAAGCTLQVTVTGGVSPDFTYSGTATWTADGSVSHFEFQGAVSRMEHGAAPSPIVTFDLPISADGSTVEPRSKGDGAFTVVFPFSGTVNSVSAALTGTGIGTATVAATVTGNEVIVSLAGVLDGTRLGITLEVDGVANAASADIGFLYGKVSGMETVVNQTDVTFVRTWVGATLTVDNFIYDLNGDGTINQSDVTFVRTAVGNSF